jgi:Ca-activated chloride channel family protein
MHPTGAVDVFAGEDLVVLARYTGSGSSVLRFDGQTANGPVTWTARVNFPDRARENPFVARLWATQRVGYLSAERRKHGASAEIDDEIKQLGERYGIPTEFNSYLVIEPGMQQQVAMARRAIGNGTLRLEAVVTSGATSGVATGAVGPPMAATTTTAPMSVAGGNATFDAAKRASELRGARTTAALDSMNRVNNGGRVTRAGNHTFALRDSVWTDTRTQAGPVLRVKAYSAAYFKVAELLPELREPFALGERVKVSGKAMSIEVTPAGSEQLTDADIAMIRKLW